MIKKSLVKEISNKETGKKTSRKFLEKLDFLIEGYIKNILKSASRKADISGRIVLKEEDI